MTVQHQQLAAGRWGQLSFAEQRANIGSEIHRALKWSRKGQPGMSRNAFYRGLELLDLSIRFCRTNPRRRELCRVRESLKDYFCGDNQFSSSDILWTKYFDAFHWAVQRKK